MPQRKSAARTGFINLGAQYLPAIQSTILVDGIVCLGAYGFNVPAMALQPFLIVSWANCFASNSALNRRVARTQRSSFSPLGAMFER